ncbi:MAG: hypothetical protein AAB682_01405, partial [Patescibacteria group bacterium]
KRERQFRILESREPCIIGLWYNQTMNNFDFFVFLLAISKLVASAKELSLIKNFDQNSESKRYVKYVLRWA